MDRPKSEKFHDSKCLQCHQSKPKEIFFAFKYHFPLLAICSSCQKTNQSSADKNSNFGASSRSVASLANRIHLWQGFSSTFKVDALFIPYYEPQPVPFEKELHFIRNLADIKQELAVELHVYDNKLPLEELLETTAGKLKTVKTLFHMRIPPLSLSTDLQHLHTMASKIIEKLTSNSSLQSVGIPLLRPSNTCPEFQLQIASTLLNAFISYLPQLQEHDIAIHLIAPDKETEPNFPSLLSLEGEIVSQKNMLESHPLLPGTSHGTSDNPTAPSTTSIMTEAVLSTNPSIFKNPFQTPAVSVHIMPPLVQTSFDTDVGPERTSKEDITFLTSSQPSSSFSPPDSSPTPLGEICLLGDRIASDPREQKNRSRFTSLGAPSTGLEPHSDLNFKTENMVFESIISDIENTGPYEEDQTITAPNLEISLSEVGITPQDELAQLLKENGMA